MASSSDKVASPGGEQTSPGVATAAIAGQTPSPADYFQVPDKKKDEDIFLDTMPSSSEKSTSPTEDKDKEMSGNTISSIPEPPPSPEDYFHIKNREKKMSGTTIASTPKKSSSRGVSFRVPSDEKVKGSPGQSPLPNTPNLEKGNDMADERPRPPLQHRPYLDRRPSRPAPTDSALMKEQLTYPEGGREAWLVVFGAWCSLTASLGLYNTAGVFEAFISRQILPDQSSSNIGWIFGLYAFVTWICGVQIGPTFDVMGPRALLIAGSICTLGSVFAISACTEYYQYILAQSILGGIGSSLLITPGMGCVSHWFFDRRGLASGIAFTGGGFGGVLFPLMMQSLLPKIGWAWSMRALGLILLVLCVCSVWFCKGRIPPRNGKPDWHDTLPNPRIFLDGTGAMAVTTAGVVLADVAYFIPVTYVPSYYMERQHLPHDQALEGSSAFAYQLLAIVNAASCVGRYAAGDLADRFGRYNTMIVMLFSCSVSVLIFWLTDVLVDLPNTGLLIFFAILFGFVSGSNTSLTPICLGQLCETQDYGRYYASCFTVVAFGVLAGIPIAGGLLDAIKVTGKEKYWGAVVFTGLAYVVGLSCFIWVRIKVKGMNWRIKW